MDDWLGELGKIRDEAIEEKERLKTLDLSVLKRSKQASDLLKVVDAHNLLRKTNSVLLGGKGLIDFQLSQKYDSSIGLMWQGSVAEAHKPDPNDKSDIFQILIGVKDKHIFVNGKRLKFNTPEDLKTALVQAAKKPNRKK